MHVRHVLYFGCKLHHVSSDCDVNAEHLGSKTLRH